MSRRGNERRRLLVLGGSGFIGRALARAASHAGCEVAAVARSKDCPVPRLADAIDEATLVGVLKSFRPDCVLHAVGMASVAAAEADPTASQAANVETFATLAKAVASVAYRPQVVLMSSAAVYGNPVRLPVEETADLAPISSYGRQKVACERIAAELTATSGIPTLSVRIFSLFGPSQRRLLVRELFERAHLPGPLQLRGTGAETRDYLSVDGFAERVLTLLDSKLPDQAAVNVASGTATSALALARLTVELLGLDKPIRCENLPSTLDPTHWQADIGLYRRLTGDDGTFDIRAALADTFKAWS